MKPTYEELENIVANQAKMIEVLLDKVDELTIQVEKLTTQVDELTKENIELKKQLNIYNGPNTPSSQKPAYKKDKKEVKAQKKSLTKENRGRKKGHEGTTLVLEATEIVDDYIPECNHCHHKIPINKQKKIYSYQEVEAPIMQLDVIQHNVYEATCSNCNCTVNTDKKNKGTMFGNNRGLL